jgi:hypothetical protein
VQYVEHPLADVEDVWRREMRGGSGLRPVLRPSSL